MIDARCPCGIAVINNEEGRDADRRNIQPTRSSGVTRCSTVTPGAGVLQPRTLSPRDLLMFFAAAAIAARTFGGTRAASSSISSARLRGSRRGDRRFAHANRAASPRLRTADDRRDGRR
jgi:hypothetical protein